MIPSFSFLLTLLFLSPTFSTQLHNFPSRRLLSSEPTTKGSGKRLGKPLIGDDGTIYACFGKFAYAFASNGSLVWNIHLNYTCNSSIAPVYGGRRKVYIVAENKVLRITSLSGKTPEPSVEVFFGNESAKETSDEIIGLSASMLTSSVYINVRNKGLFSYTLRKQLRWSAPPVLNRFGYRQGCKKNVTGCHFTSVPVIDHCEASIYISNNEGQLYSIAARRPYFRWIQDFSSYDKVFTTTPGNNGRVYVTVPSKAIVVGLDVSTGDVLWEKRIGPLSSADYSPTVDSNGWISIGSLDGYLYSISPTGVLNKFSKASPLDSVVQVSPVRDCSGYAVYFSQTEVEGKSSRIVGDYMFVSAMKPRGVVFSLLVPATGSFYWSEIYPGQFGSNLSQSNLHNFVLDEEIVLAFIAAANIGNPLRCQSTRVKLAISCSQMRPKSVSVYTGNERTILLFLLLETVILVVLAIAVRFCWIFWGKRKLQNQDLGKFLEKRRSLRIKKKEFDHKISELEQKAADEATTSDVLEKLSGLVRQREGIVRKLSTSYSLGRDNTNVAPKSVLPVYDGKTRSYSFQGSKRESVTIFHSYSGTSSDYENSQDTDSEKILHREIELAAKAKVKGKAKVNESMSCLGTSSSDEDYDDYDMEDFYGTSSRSSSGSRGFPGNLHVDDDLDRRVSMFDEKEGTKFVRSRHIGRTWLKKRRSLSSTN